jgi:hypothetical protein
MLFKKLATLRIDASLFYDVEELRWCGPTASFQSMAERVGDTRLGKRVHDLENRLRDKRLIE